MTATVTVPISRVYVLNEKSFAILKRAGILACPICKKPFELGMQLVKGTKHIHRSTWPRCIDCCMVDSRPKTGGRS